MSIGSIRSSIGESGSDVKTVSIIFEKDDCRMIRTNKDGTQSSKHISPKDLCAYLSKKNTITRNILPYGARVSSTCNNTCIIVYMYPSRIIPTYLRWGSDQSEMYGRYEDNIPEEGDAIIGDHNSNREYRRFLIPWPAVAFFTVVKKCSKGEHGADADYALDEQYLYAIEDETIPLAETKLYRLPFTNLFSDNRCCLGHGYEGVTVKGLDGCSFFPSLSINGIGNRDLTSGNNVNNSTNGRFGVVRDDYELIAKLDKEQTFPFEYCLPLSSSTRNTTILTRLSELENSYM